MRAKDILSKQMRVSETGAEVDMSLTNVLIITSLSYLAM